MAIDRTSTARGSIASAAALFRGFADPTRLAIVLALAQGERRVTDLLDEVGTSQPNISAHIACLKDCGLVEGRADGRQVFYRLAHEEVFTLLEAAEAVLHAAGTSIQLCPVYGDSRRDD